MRLQIEIDRRARGNVAQLGLPEVRHDVPGAGVDEGEDLGAGPRERADRDVEIDHPAAEGRPHAGVLEVQLGRADSGFRRGQARVGVGHLADGVLGPGALAPGLFQGRLGGDVLSAGGGQVGDGGAPAGARLVDGGVGRHDGGTRLLRGHRRRDLARARLVHAVLGHELLRQQRLEACEMVLGVPQLGLGPAQGGLGRGALRLQPRDLGVGRDRIRFPPRDVGGRGVELGGGARDAGGGDGDAVAESVDLLARQGQGSPGAGERDLVGAGVDDEEKVAFLDLLVVLDPQLDDVPRHLGRDAHEVRPHRGVVRLRTPLPLQQRDDHGDEGAHDDQGADQPSGDASCSRIRHVVVPIHRYTLKSATQSTRVTRSARQG